MNKVTERRMKLFDDAEHYGAEIIKTSKWTCAICRTYDQTHCFGRGKPKVVPNTNDIDQSANLRDDEGITDESKKIRDSKAEWVKDGLSNEMDKQPFEAGWCVMGGNEMFPGSTLAWGPGLRPCSSYIGVKNYCNGAVADEVCPLLVFLEHDTGKLYISNLQYSKYGMLPLSGGWCISDYNCEINGYNEGGIRKRLLSDGDFAEIYQLAADKSLEGMTGAVKVDVLKSAKEYVSRFTSYSPEMTVQKIYNAMYQAGCRTGMSMYIEADGKIIPITKIVEGVGSSVVLVAIAGKRAMRISEFIDYSRKHIADDRMFRFRKLEIRYTGVTLEPKDSVEASDNKCILFV